MKIDRLIAIIMVLLSRKRLSAKELSAMFEVSIRTIYRDIDSIDIAGIPIYAVPGVGGGFEIMEAYKIDKKIFSTQELSILLNGLSSLSNLFQSDDHTNALAKIKSFIPEDKIETIESQANQVHIDMTIWSGRTHVKEYLAVVMSAIREQKVLSFEYEDRFGNQTHRIAEPYQLLLKSNHWYWQGYCLEREDFRLFKLDRVVAIHESGKIFLPREYQTLQLEFPESITAMQLTVTLRIHKSIKSRLLDYCHFEQFISDGAEHFLVAFPFIENEYYYDLILGFGEKCECLSPIYVREGIKEKIMAISTLYKNKEIK